jgi:Holliday junction resolvasome RuvABC endonuclease subunit
MENNKVYRYTIGIDPSGAYDEGKGTTGWCVLDNKTNAVLQVGTLAAKDYETVHAYWDAHITLIKALLKQYGFSTAISIEDYILYKNYAMAQVNSTLETVQLLGIIKHYCYQYSVNYFIRPAVAVKIRWADDILVHKGCIAKINKHYVAPCNPTKRLCDHERDAIRHAMHFNAFENRE